MTTLYVQSSAFLQSKREPANYLYMSECETVSCATADTICPMTRPTSHDSQVLSHFISCQVDTWFTMYLRYLFTFLIRTRFRSIENFAEPRFVSYGSNGWCIRTVLYFLVTQVFGGLFALHSCTYILLRMCRLQSNQLVAVDSAGSKRGRSDMAEPAFGIVMTHFSPFPESGPLHWAFPRRVAFRARPSGRMIAAPSARS